MPRKNNTKHPVYKARCRETDRLIKRLRKEILKKDSADESTTTKKNRI